MFRTVCKQCSKTIWICRTQRGRWQPLDPEPAPVGTIVVRAGVAYTVSRYFQPDPDEPLYVCHFATCEARR